MATTLSRNLKLRINSNLTADAKFNLEKLDLLGANVYTDSTDTLYMRSRGNVIIEPESADINGAGSGGSVQLGTASHQLASFIVYADSIDLQEADLGVGSLQLQNGSYYTSLEAGVQSANISYVLPTSAPTASQILRANASNPLQLEWASSTGSGVNQAVSTWALADGTTKNVTHGLGTEDIDVTVIDNNNQVIFVDNITVVDNNSISLTSSETPTGNWTVIIQGN